jgi:hypothetical protein
VGSVLSWVVGAGGVLLEEGGEAVGGVPAGQRGASGCGGCGVEEPDPALGLELAEVGAAVGGEEEGEDVLAPGAARGELVGGEGVAAAVALGLLEGGGDVLGLALGLDDSDRLEAAEQDVVGGAGRSGPFGDGEVFSLLRADAFAVGELDAVDLPTGQAELGVDEAAGGRFVEVEGVGGAGGVFDDGGGVGGRCGGGGGLERGELLSEVGLGCGCLGGEVLPNGALFGVLLGALFGGEALFGGGGGRNLGCLGRRLLSGELFAEALQFVGEGDALSPRISRGDKGACLKGGSGEGTVEPDAEGAGGAEEREGFAVVALEAVYSGVAGLAEVVEEIGDLAREEAAVAEAGEQFELTLLGG